MQGHSGQRVDERRAQPVAGSVSHSTTLRVVPLSQEGEDKI